jgi:hypothetical protein
MKGRIDKRVWGVLGKQQTYFSPQKQVEGKTKTPLNANAFDSWDAKRSTFRRVDGYQNAIQQGGTVIGQTTPVPDVSPTPTSTPQSTPSFTPSETPTNTPTPSITPSSTPFPFVQPSLWFDASDSTTMNLILSGGTTLISQITSKGTSNWTLTGQTSDRYPTYSASTSLPGSPNIIRFTPNATASLRKALVAFDRPTLTHTGSTIFMVWSQPAGTPAFVNQVYSGNTNGTLVVSGTDTLDRLQFGAIATNIANTNIYPQNSSQVAGIPAPFSATNLNGKYLMKAVLPANPGFGSWELNQSGGTGTLLFTGTTVSPRWNAFNLGCTSNSTQQLFAINNNIELAEMMVYNRELSSSEQEAVELYLRDKWRYDEWASPVPTPTPTPTATIPAGGAQANAYLTAVVNAGGTGITSTVSAATQTLFANIWANGLNSKLIAMYPLLGGNSSGCKFNGMNPLDTNAAYRLAFNGGWTFDASGATSNGDNGYANTYLSGNTITPNDNHLSVYMRDNTAINTKTYLGYGEGSTNFLLSNGGDNNHYYYYGLDTAGIVSTTSATTSGLNLITTTGTSFQNLYRNGSVVLSNSGAATGTTNQELVIGALNNAGSVDQYYGNQYRFITVGFGLSEAQQSTLASIINTFQASLGRNTY